MGQNILAFTWSMSRSEYVGLYLEYEQARVAVLLVSTSRSEYTGFAPGV